MQYSSVGHLLHFDLLTYTKMHLGKGNRQACSGYTVYILYSMLLQPTCKEKKIENKKKLNKCYATSNIINPFGYMYGKNLAIKCISSIDFCDSFFLCAHTQYSFSMESEIPVQWYPRMAKFLKFARYGTWKFLRTEN